MDEEQARVGVDEDLEAELEEERRKPRLSWTELLDRFACATMVSAAA